MKVQELVQQKNTIVHSVQETATVSDAASLFLAKNISSVLVCKGDEVVGIFTKNDFLRRYLESPSDFAKQPVHNPNARPLFSTTPNADLGAVLSAMIERGLHHVPVLDGGKAVGMVTPIDILLHMKEVLHFENEQLIQYIRSSS